MKLDTLYPFNIVAAGISGRCAESVRQPGSGCKSFYPDR